MSTISHPKDGVVELLYFNISFSSSICTGGRQLEKIGNPAQFSILGTAKKTSRKRGMRRGGSLLLYCRCSRAAGFVPHVRFFSTSSGNAKFVTLSNIAKTI